MKTYTHVFIILLSILSWRIIAQDAPLTIAPTITDAVPGNVNVAVTVEGFEAIGAFDLELLYNPLVLSYVSAAPHASLTASFNVTSTPIAPGSAKLNISYSYGGPAVTLGDGSTLATLTFTFTLDNEINHSALTWSDNGPSCEYRDAGNNPLPDSPTNDYYTNGLVASQVAPVTHLPALDFFTTGAFELPVTADNFDNIGSLSLTFEYDPGTITYEGTFSSTLPGLGVSDQNSNNGMRKIVVGWFGASPVTIANGGEIATLDFEYLSGSTSLHWLDNGTSCEYSDATYSSLWDNPTADFYREGQVSPTPAPRIKADTVQSLSGQAVIIPLTVMGFNDINSMNLTLDYNESALAFLCATLIPGLPGTFEAGDIATGRLNINWTSPTEESLPDGSVIIYLAFDYLGGTVALEWYDNGTDCEFTTGTSYIPLLDVPSSQFYHNGLVEAAPGSSTWTGSASSDWQTAANWQDNKVPDGSRDVTITTSNSPSNWPEFDGDLTVGIGCKNITLEGAAALTITGDLILDAGHMLEMTGSGLLNIGGDWINEGVFSPGTGTVEFTGSQPGIIPMDVHPGNALSNYDCSSFGAGMTHLEGVGSILTGDNAHIDAGIGFDFKYLGVNYDNLRLNTNGWATLDLSGEDAISAENSRLFCADLPSTVLAPWWDDLKADGSSAISVKTEGTSPFRVFTAEWENMLSYATGSTSRLNFQLKLYETTNVIEFCYGTVSSGTHNSDEGASIGLNDGGGGGGGCFLEATTGSNCNIITCFASNTNWPASNFRFSPPLSSDREIFWKVSVTKTGGAQLQIMRDTHLTGITE